MSGYFSDILEENKFPKARDLKTSTRAVIP